MRGISRSLVLLVALIFCFYSQSEMLNKKIQEQTILSIWELKTNQPLSEDSPNQITGFFISPDSFVVSLPRLKKLIGDDKKAIEDLILTQEGSEEVLHIQSLQDSSDVEKTAILKTKEKVENYLKVRRNYNLLSDESFFTFSYVNGTLEMMRNIKSLVHKDSHSYSFPANYTFEGDIMIGSPIVSRLGRLSGVVSRVDGNKVNSLRIKYEDSILNKNSQYFNDKMHNKKIQEQTILSIWELKTNQSLLKNSPNRITGFFIDSDSFAVSLPMFKKIIDNDKKAIEDLILTQEGSEEVLHIKSLQDSSDVEGMVILKTKEKVKNYLKIKKRNYTIPGGSSFIFSYVNGTLKKTEKTGEVIYQDDFSYSFPANHTFKVDVMIGSPIVSGFGLLMGVVFGVDENVVNSLKIKYENSILNKDVQYLRREMYYRKIQKQTILSIWELKTKQLLSKDSSNRITGFFISPDSFVVSLPMLKKLVGDDKKAIEDLVLTRKGFRRVLHIQSLQDSSDIEGIAILKTKKNVKNYLKVRQNYNLISDERFVIFSYVNGTLEMMRNIKGPVHKDSHSYSFPANYTFEGDVMIGSPIVSKSGRLSGIVSGVDGDKVSSLRIKYEDSILNKNSQYSHSQMHNKIIQKKTMLSIWELKTNQPLSEDSPNQITGFFISPDSFVVNLPMFKKLIGDDKKAVENLVLIQEGSEEVLHIKSLQNSSDIEGIAILKTKEKVKNYLKVKKRNYTILSGSSFIFSYVNGTLRKMEQIGNIIYQDNFSYSFPANQTFKGDVMIGSPIVSKLGTLKSIVSGVDGNIVNSLKMKYRDSILNKSSQYSHSQMRNKTLQKQTMLSIWELKTNQPLSKDSPNQTTGFFISPDSFVLSLPMLKKLIGDDKKAVEDLILTQEGSEEVLHIQSLQNSSDIEGIAILKTKEKVKNYLKARVTNYMFPGESSFIFNYVNGTLKKTEKMGEVTYQDDFSYSFPVNQTFEGDVMIGSPIISRFGLLIGVVSGVDGNKISSSKVEYKYSLLNKDRQYHHSEMRNRKQAMLSVWELKTKKPLSKDSLDRTTGFFIDSDSFVVSLPMLKKLINNDKKAVENLVLTQKGFRKILHIQSLQDFSVVERIAILKTKEKVKNYLGVRKKNMDPSEPFFVFSYINKALKSMGKIGDIIYQDSLFYSFSINQTFEGDIMIGSPVVSKRGQLIGVISGVDGNIVDSLKIQYEDSILYRRSQNYYKFGVFNIEKAVESLLRAFYKGDSIAQKRLFLGGNKDKAKIIYDSLDQNKKRYNKRYKKIDQFKKCMKAFSPV